MSRTDQQAFDELCHFVRETALLVSTFSLLGWDERTGLPSKATDYRGEQMTFLAALIHRRQTDPKLTGWLEQLVDSPLATEVASDNSTVIRYLKREHDRQLKLPESLVKELTRTAVQGQHLWQQAREQDDFHIFQPNLEKMIGLKQQEADALGFIDCRYDALLDEYEPLEKTSRVGDLLGQLRNELVPLVQEIADCGRTSRVDFLKRTYPIESQKDFGKRVAEQIGFDFSRGRLDDTIHPFCTGLGPQDTRITTRYDEHFLPTSFFGILHEAGHGIYEQGLRPEWYGLPPGQTISLGIHESQSRIWENQVGRSRAFWEYCFPQAQRIFPGALGDISLDHFYEAINRVEPSLIRVEADEATYNLHILIRFELEQALLEGDLATVDLPAAWDDKYRKYLGICPQTASEGVLQDIHWSGGAIGYFPTYALGNLYSAQFYAQADKDLGGVANQFTEGNFDPFREWLRKNIHLPGQCYSAAELVLRVTGEPLSHHHLVDHLRSKLTPLYGLSSI